MASLLMWNGLIIDSLLTEVQDQCLEEDWPVQGPDPYVREILMERYKQLWTVWQKGQPKITDDGTAETPAEIKVRLIAERETCRILSMSLYVLAVSSTVPVEYSVCH
jgi:hypothetical protein